MTEKELAVYDPKKKQILQTFTDMPDSHTGKLTAIGVQNSLAVVAYNPNPASKKQSRTVL